MILNDLNFKPEFKEAVLPNPVDKISPLSFVSNINNNVNVNPEITESYDWKKDLSEFVRKNPDAGVSTPYQYNKQSNEKYHESLIGKPIFKDPRYYDNEDLNAQRQGFLGSLFNGSAKMAGSFGQSFVSTFNPFGYDNSVSNAMQDFSKNMENWFPNYYSKEEREDPLSFNSIFSGNFLGDKLIKNLGFMGGAISAALLQDAIIGTMTGGTALAPTLALQAGKASNWLSKAFKANTLASKLIAAEKVENFLAPTIFKGEKALEYFNNMTKGQKLLTSVKTNLFLANASHGEAAIEALEGLTRVKEDLIQSYKEKNGVLPDAIAMAEINKLASEAGNIRYGLNFATIFLTDAIQFSSLFKPFKSYTTGQTLLQGLGGAGDRLILNETGQLVRRNLSKSERILGGLTGNLVQANTSETMQEGLQYSFETATHDYAKKKWNGEIRGGLGDYLHEQVNGLKRMVTDTEGKESMLLGFLTGFAAHGFKKGVEKIQGRPSLSEREDSIMSDFNSIDFNKMFDTTELSELVKRDVETFNGRTTQEIILNQMQDAVKSGNVFNFKSLQHELFFNGIRTANALGKFDAFTEKLDAMKQLAPEEFSKVFGIEVKDSNVVSQYIDKLKDQAIKTKEIIEAVDNTVPNTIDYKKDSKLWTAFNDLKTTMSFHLSSLDNITSRIDSVTSTLLENNPSMTEDLIDKISDLENFSNKFLSPLNQERKSILSTLDLMSQLKEGRDEELFTKTKQQLKDLDNHIDNLNKHANTLKEHFEKTNNWTSDAILNYKQLVLEVLQYNQQKESGNKIAYTETQLEDTLKALIDFQKLKKSLGIVIDESNNLQTPEGRDKYLKEHLAFLEKYSDSFSEMIKKVNLSTVQKFRDQEISTIATSITENYNQIESINNQIEEIDKQLLDDAAENKDQLQLRKDELLKQKQELLDENKELEETKKVIEGKSKEDTQEQNTLNTTNNSESEIVERLSEIILPNLGENLFNNINEKINKTKEELQKINQEVVTNNDLLIYLNNKLEFYLQKINNEQIKIDKQLEKLPNTKYSKKQKQEKHEELISKHKDLLLAAQDIQDRINEIEKINNIQKQEIEDLEKKIQYYQSILNTEKTHTVELQQKLATTKSSLEKTNRLIEKTESYIDRLKSLLKEIVKAISNRISILNDFLESQGKNTPKLQEDIAKIKTQLLQDNIDGELFVEFNKLEKDVNDVLDHEEINQELLDKAELLLQTQIEKAIKLQNEIRYLSELFQENLNEVKKENTNPSSPQNKKIVEEIKQEVVEEEKPEVIAEEVKPVPIPVTITRETVIIQTPTPEVEEIPFFGTSRLMQSFYYKLANRTFGNVMIASFHNFLGKLRTFDGVAHKQNLESFLNQNNLQFTVLLAPDELYTPNGDYFDEAYKDKKAPIVALTDKEGNLVKVDKNNNLSDDGNYIVSLLPPVNKDATDLQDFNSTVEKVKNGEKVSVEVDASHAGHFNFLRQPKEFVLTPEILENPNVTLEIPNTKEAREVNGYTLMPGKLYLKIANNRNKSLMFLDVKLNKLNQISINGKSLPKTIYDSVLHIINNADESLSYKQELDNFLNSILYVTAYKGSPKREPVIVQVNDDFYQFKIDTTSNEPSFTIEKNKEVIFELSNTKKDDVATLQNILKLFDLNDTEQGEIKIPILERGKLRFETQDYIDFLVQNANPTVRYELDFSMENPFDFTGGEIYFKTPSKVEEVFANTETSKVEQHPTSTTQSEIEDKKADTERRRQEELEKTIIDENDLLTLNAIKEKGDTERLNREIKRLAGKTKEGSELLQKHKAEDTVNDVSKSLEERVTASLFLEGLNNEDKIGNNSVESYGYKASFNDSTVSDVLININKLINDILFGRTHLVDDKERILFKTIIKQLRATTNGKDVSLANKLEAIQSVTSPLKGDSYGIYNGEKIYGKTVQEVKDKINSKYDAEQKEATIDEKTLEGFSSEEDLAKAFGTKPLEQNNDNSELTKEVVESVVKPIKKFNKNNNKGPIFSSKKLPIVQSLNITNTDIERVKAIFKGNVNIENLFQIANSDAWATFQQSAITLFKGATRADLYHEAWHHFSQLYLTKDEKVKLYEETRNKVKDLKDKSDLEVEEYIAREFAKFTETGKIEGKFPERKSIFQKIMDFLKSIFSNETDLSLDSLFNNLYKGQINHLAYNTENIMFGKLNSGINDNFNYNDSKLIESGLNGLFIQVLKDYEASISEISKIKNINRIYDEIEDYLIDEYEGSKNPIIFSNLERVLENWNDVKKFHFNTSGIFNKDRDSYEFDDDGNLVSKEENEDDKKGRNKADFQEASEKSIFDIMDKEVKSLIFTLVDKDKNGNEIVDPIFGLPKLVDFQRYVSIISEKLSNQNTFEEVEKVLNKLSKDYPPMKDLLNSLTINESDEVKHLRVQFIQNMALVKRELYVVLYNEESKTYNIKAAQSNKQNQVENDIKTYFVISPETKFIKKVNGENQITEPIVYENKDEGLDYDLPFIKSLGINLDVLDYLTEQQQIKFVKDFNIIFVVEHLNNYLKENGAIKDIFKALKTKVNGKTQESAFKPLVDYNLTYLPENISSSFLNASGKIENENVMWATFDKDFNALQKAKTIQELIENPNRKFYNPNNLDISSSKIMDLLFDQSGKRTKYKIDIQNYNGLASEKEGVDGKKTKEVFYTEKAIMDISQFMNRNILTTMQLSNKATYFGLELPKKLIEGKYEFEQTMLSYLFDELNIIYQFDQKNPELIKLKKLSDSIGTKGKYNLAIFKDILTSNTQEIIDEYLETGNLSNETQDFVLSQINQFFEIELKKAVDVLQDDLYKIVPSKSSSYFEAKNFKPEEVIRDYIQNQFVMNVELSKLIFGNPYMHKDPYKRIAGATSSKRRLLADKRTLEDFKSVTKETQRSSIMPILLERLKLKSYVLKNQRTSDDELRFISFKDREKMSDSYDNLLSVVTKELKKTKEGTPEHYSLLQKKIAIEKAYSNVNGSDAMGAITMDAWRKFNWLAGRWSTELEKIYQKTIKWDYHNRLLKASKTEEEKTKQLALRNENTITDAEGLAISVMKYQYYGNIKNDSIMEKAFHKYQLMPLIPQLIEGKLWEQHLDRMILEDVDYALFDSADKLEKSKTLDAFYNNADLDNVNVLEDYESYYKEGNTSYNVRTGYLENIGEQVFMENGTDYSLLFGSQVRKLLFNTEDFSDLYDEFRNVIQQLTQIEKDNLYQKSGLNENGQVVDKPKFIQFLLDELDKKVVNSNVKEYLRLTKAGEFAGSLDTNLQRQPIEQIVNSVLQSKIVKQKMHGELMVQVSNVGFETFGKKDSLKFYGFEQDGKVRKMEVKVPLSGKFKNLLNLVIDGRKVETRERLNQLIKEGKIDQRSLTMVGYRIPTQEHNSIEVMQVQEFLDPISNLIVVPYEITAKAGSDFDIDKLNIFKPHIDENGNYLTKDMRDSITENLNKIQAEIDQLKVNKKISSTKQSNKYLEILSKAKLTSQEITEILEYRDSLSSEIGELYSELKSFSKLDNNNPMFSQFSKLGIIENNVETEKELLDKINLKIEEKRKQFSVLEKTIDQKSILDNELKTQSEKQKQKTLEYNNKIEPLYEQKYSIKKLLKSFDKFSYQNKILELFDKVLLSPDNFLNLITPNSTFMFDEALNDVFKKRYKSNEYYEKNGKLMPNDIKYTKSLIPRYNWFTFKVLGEAGLGLGIAAVGNTFSQLIQKAKVNFTEEYLSNYNLRIPIGDISTRVLKDGQPKATAYSQLINLLVDVANDPRVGYANMGDSVIPIVNLMINFGTPIQDIVYFINQPIIVDYVSYISKNRKSVVDGEYQEDGFASYLKDKILNHQKTPLKLPEAVSNYLNLTAQELSEKLSDVEFNASKESMGYKLKEVSDMTEKVSQEQLLILAQFAQMEQIAKDFLQLQVTMNFDTSLVQDGFEAYQKEELFKEIKGKDIFTNLDDLREKTVIAPLNVLKEVVNINAQLLPLANDKVIYNFLSAKLATEFANKGNKAKKKFVRTFKNDFIMYLFQNFMDRNPDAMLRFNITFAPVLKTKEKDYTNRPIAFGNYLIKNLYKEFADIKNDPKYKDLFKQYLLLDRLFVSSEEEIKNIGLSYFNKDSQLQDTYIEQFKELLNNPDLEIKNFMLKFAYMSFYQSGINKSFISSTDILPVPILSGMLEDVREQYLKEFNSPVKKLNLLADFYTLLKANNEFLRSGTIETIIDGEKIKEKAKNKKFNLTKVSSYRGKNFRTNIDNLLIQPVNIPIQQSEEEGLQDDSFIFEYKGKKINTEFLLSEDQSKALQDLIDFTKDNNESSIVLQGAAGTGKTSIIGYLQKYLNEQFLYTAPTHAATVELAFGTMKTGNTILPITVASSLKLNKNTNKHILSKKASNKIGFGTIIVVDETSMLNTYDYKKLLDLKELGYKLIFIGDKKQIPEVSKAKNLDFKTISNAFTENKTINLDVIHRTSNENIKNILQKVRDSITFQLFKLKQNTKNVQFFKSDVSFKQKLKEFVLKDPQNTDYIGYTNKAVNSMNKLIREQIFGRKGEIQKEDIVMGYLGYQSKQIEKSDLANSISYKVENVEKTKNGYNLTLSSERLTELRKKGFNEIGEFSYTTLLPLSNKEAIENSFDQKVYDENNKELSTKFNTLYEYLQQAKKSNSGKDWVKYFNYHEGLSLYMAKNDLAADYIYNVYTNKFELYDKTEPSEEHQKLLSFYKTESNNFIVEKGIDFGHAITVHKSQGRTTKNVFFDANTIRKGDIKIMEKDKQISTENQSLGYVGLSRASENLFVNEGWVSFEEIDTVKENISQQTTEQPTNKEIKPNIDSSKKINIYAGTNENAELSNFAVRPFKITNQIFNGTFNTVEGAFQAQKIGYIGNKVEQQLAKNKIAKLQTATGSEAKSIGRKISGLDVSRWDTNSSKIMKDLIKQSFEQNPKALQQLLATGNAELTHTQDKGKWGKEFPKLLMEVRQELTQEQPIVEENNQEITKEDTDKLPPCIG